MKELKIKSVQIEAKVLLDDDEIITGQQTDIFLPPDPDFSNLEKHLSMGLILVTGEVYRKLIKKMGDEGKNTTEKEPQ